MSLSFLLAFLTLGSAGRATMGTVQTASLGGVPAARLERLQRGINLSYWARTNRPADYYRTYLTPTDWAFFRDYGIRHIRLAIDPALVFDPADPSHLLSGVRYVDDAVAQLNAAGLMVILDFHDTGALGLDAPGADQVAFFTFWKTFAAHFASTSPDMVMFEILNEPRFRDNPGTWYAMQRQAIAVIRAVAPQHTIVATCTHWSSVHTLASFQPYTASNVVYTVHSYEPMLFTHQGAYWGDDVLKNMHGVRYPASSDSIAAARSANPGAGAQRALDEYADQGWNATSLDALIKTVADWRDTYQRPVYMGECGALAAVPTADRLRYLGDFVSALRHYGIPYAPWSYEDKQGFSVLRDRRADGTVTVDRASASVLFP